MTILYILACIVLGVLSVALAFRCFIDWRKKWPEKPRRKIFVYSFNEYERQDAKERIEAMGYVAVLAENDFDKDLLAVLDPLVIAVLDCYNPQNKDIHAKKINTYFRDIGEDRRVKFITNLSEIKEAGK